MATFSGNSVVRQRKVCLVDRAIGSTLPNSFMNVILAKLNSKARKLQSQRARYLPNQTSNFSVICKDGNAGDKQSIALDRIDYKGLENSLSRRNWFLSSATIIGALVSPKLARSVEAQKDDNSSPAPKLESPAPPPAPKNTQAMPEAKSTSSNTEGSVPSLDIADSNKFAESGLDDEKEKKEKEKADKAKEKKKGFRSRITELQELRADLAEKEKMLLQKEEILLNQEQTVQVLEEQLTLERRLRELLSKEKKSAEEEAALAIGLCSNMYGGISAP